MSADIDVDPVERVQVVEVDEVILRVQRRVHQVADRVLAFFGILIPSVSPTARTEASACTPVRRRAGSAR
ncbi:MAG: hypothetical protein U0807_19300 [Candidatus Binatia bacterium]